MSDLIVANSEKFSHWLVQKFDGIKFPVPFDLAWQIAGYSRKDVAKRKLSTLQVNVDFSTEKWKSNGGRDLEIIYLSIEAFKHICLMAETDQGRDIRNYFIDAQEKWELVKRVSPSVAAETEELHLKLTLAELENDNLRRRESLELRREANVLTHGKELAAFIAGADIVHVTETVAKTVVVDERGRVRAEYDGLGITALAAKYGFGKGTKANNACRTWIKSLGITDDEWKDELIAQHTAKLPRDLMPLLDNAFKSGRGNRQMLLGE